MKKDIFDSTNYLAIVLLEYVGVEEPTQEAIDVMESALSHVVLKQELLFGSCLNQKERTCLFLAAKGKTCDETAYIMKLSPAAIENCRRSIKRKLKATSMAHAVFEGMRLGYFHKQDFSESSEGR